MTAVLLDKEDIIESSVTEQPVPKDNTTHRAAFMILIDKDGNFIFESDINKPVIPQRRATPTEIKSALHLILDQVNAEDAAMVLMTIQEIKMRQYMEAQQNQQMLQGLKLK
jgi:hypothetical protein